MTRGSKGEYLNGKRISYNGIGKYSMSTAYKFNNPTGIYFISMATVEWVDVFTRKEYVAIVLESLKHCQKEKGLIIYAWCIMSNHVHLIISAKEGYIISGIVRDFKKLHQSVL